MEFIKVDDGEDVDKTSLKYKLRKAIITYFNKRLSERIQKFTRGQTMNEGEAEEESLTSEEVVRKFFFNLAELLHEKKLSLMSIIKKNVFDALYFQKEVQLIYIDDFFKSLREVGMRYTQRQKDEVTASMHIQELSGRFLLEMIDNILNNLGIKKGLPVSTRAMNYDSLDLKSIRIINRILKFCKLELSQKNNSLLEQSDTKISPEEITNFLYQQLKSYIKIVEIVDGKGNPTDIEYIESDDLSKFLRSSYVILSKPGGSGSEGKIKTRIITEMELHETLQFLLCISPNSALEKIMVKKFLALITQAAENEYILAIGGVRRPDPKDDEEEDEVAQVVEEGKKGLEDQDEDFDEVDLSDIDEKAQKKMERDQKMWERRKNRKSTKRIHV